MANKKNDKQKQPIVDYYKMMSERFHRYLDARSPEQLKKSLVVWSIVAVVLTAAASIPLPESFRALSAAVGTPAGIIVFFIFAGLFRESSWRDSKLASMKERISPAKRKYAVLIGAAVFIIVMVFSASFIPYGIGGVLVVCAALFVFYFLSKTDEEKELDKLGLPDPRDYPEYYEENTEEVYEYEEIDDREQG